MASMPLQEPIHPPVTYWAGLAAASTVGGRAEEQPPLLAFLRGSMDYGFVCPPPADSGHLESCVTQVAAPTTRAARRRKRCSLLPPPPRRGKKPEEAESQRMAHIAVERNRRRLMNDHLASLRSLVPAHYIPRGDQATVVEGTIEYVKRLEQQLAALRSAAAAALPRGGGGCAIAVPVSEGALVAPQYTSYSEAGGHGVDVEATAAVGRHVRVRVAGRRWPGRLVRAVAAMEELRLAVLHLTVTSAGGDAVAYCFNLKIEEGCELVMADEVATVVHRIFAYAAGIC